MKRVLFVLVGLIFVASSAHAQVVIAPQTAQFTHDDPNFAITAAYHTDFFQCTSVTVNAANPSGVCVGRSGTPFQAGFDTPKAQITGTSPTRIINLKATPASGLLASVPLGTGIVAVVTAIGDTSIPGIAGTSPGSNDSNPFFSAARTPVAPGPPVVR